LRSVRAVEREFEKAHGIQVERSRAAGCAAAVKDKPAVACHPAAGTAAENGDQLLDTRVVKIVRDRQRAEFAVNPAADRVVAKDFPAPQPFNLLRDPAAQTEVEVEAWIFNSGPFPAEEVLFSITAGCLL